MGYHICYAALYACEHTWTAPSAPIGEPQWRSKNPVYVMQLTLRSTLVTPPPPLLLVLLVSKSSLQQSPLGEARLQGLRAEVLVEIGWIGCHQIWQPWLGNRNTKAPIHRAIAIHAVLQGVAAPTRSVQPAKTKLRTETDNPASILLPQRTVAWYCGLHTSNCGRQCTTL